MKECANFPKVKMSSLDATEAKMTVISRVGLRAKPAKNHPEFKEWETANVVVLVAASSR